MPTLKINRPSDALEAIAKQIEDRAVKSLESTKDPEDLLKERKALRAQHESLQAKIKQKEAKDKKALTLRNKQLKKWEAFLSEMKEISLKYGIDINHYPTHAAGSSFIERLQNAQPDRLATVDGNPIQPYPNRSRLDQDYEDLFEIETKQEHLEQIIARKGQALKELFSQDAE